MEMRLVKKNVWNVVEENKIVAEVEQDGTAYFITPTFNKDPEWQRFDEVMDVVKFVIRVLYGEQEVKPTDMGCRDDEAIHYIGSSGTIYHVCLSDYPRVFVEPE